MLTIDEVMFEQAWDPALATAMQIHVKSIHEEALAPALLKDLEPQR
jgi:hypothetical protein